MSSPKTTIFVSPNEPACSAGSVFRRVQSPIKALTFRRGSFTLLRHVSPIEWKNVILYGEIKIDPAKLKMREP